MKYLFIFIFLLTGCDSMPSITKSPTDVYSKVPISPRPEKTQLREIQFIVITKDNHADIMNDQQVLYALTPETLKNLGYDVEDILRYIKQQSELIKYYDSQELYIKKPIKPEDGK